MQPQYFLIFTIILLTSFLIRRFRKKLYKPKYEEDIQKPGGLGRIIAKLFIFLDIFVIAFALLGLFMKEIEMAIVFGILAFVFLILTFIIKRAQDISYQENEEYFILHTKQKEQKVYYKNIIGWHPSNNEIAVIDQTQTNKKPIRVNLLMFKPEILLRKMIEMAFSGKFDNEDLTSVENEEKRIDLINYLVDYQYNYLLENYIEQAENKINN